MSVCVCGNLCFTRYCLQGHQRHSIWPSATKLQSRCQDMRSDQLHVPAVFQNGAVETVPSESRSVDVQ